jgi:hypothetical protein
MEVKRKKEKGKSKRAGELNTDNGYALWMLVLSHAI